MAAFDAICSAQKGSSTRRLEPYLSLLFFSPPLMPPWVARFFVLLRATTRVEARARLGHRGSASAPPTPLSCSYGLIPTVPRMLAFVRRPCDLR